MVEETLTVGDTEVVVRQTADGFEVEEADSEPEGTYIRFESDNRTPYGCEIPIDSEFDVEPSETGQKLCVGWHQEDDISDMQQRGSSRMRDHEGKGYDGYASVNPDKTEIVQY